MQRVALLGCAQSATRWLCGRGGVPKEGRCKERTLGCGRAAGGAGGAPRERQRKQKLGYCMTLFRHQMHETAEKAYGHKINKWVLVWPTQSAGLTGCDDETNGNHGPPYRPPAPAHPHARRGRPCRVINVPHAHLSRNSCSSGGRNAPRHAVPAPIARAVAPVVRCVPRHTYRSIAFLPSQLYIAPAAGRRRAPRGRRGRRGARACVQSVVCEPALSSVAHPVLGLEGGHRRVVRLRAFLPASEPFGERQHRLGAWHLLFDHLGERRFVESCQRPWRC